MNDNLKSELLSFFHELMTQDREILDKGDYSDLLSLCEQDITILSYLEQHQNVTAKGISEALIVPKTTIVTAVARLEKRGYLKKIQNEEDRREMYLALTPKGDKANQEHYQYENLVVESIMKRWNDPDQKALAQLLNRRRPL